MGCFSEKKHKLELVGLTQAVIMWCSTAAAVTIYRAGRCVTQYSAVRPLFLTALQSGEPAALYPLL